MLAVTRFASNPGRSRRFCCRMEQPRRREWARALGGYAGMVVLPQFIVVLALLCLAVGLASVPLWVRYGSDGKAPFGRIVPHPRNPGSMLAFAALPTFLILMTLARFILLVEPGNPVNSPDNFDGRLHHPRDADASFDRARGNDDGPHFTYPRNTADLTSKTARRAASASQERRIQGVHDLAWWTSVCPNYAPFTVPKLAGALRDPDPAVKGAAAIALGSVGGYGTTAIPDLRAARGTSVRYFDHLVDEAVYLIEHSPRWPPADECEKVSVEELERRTEQARDESAEACEVGTEQ